MQTNSSEFNDIRHLFSDEQTAWRAGADSDTVIVYPPTIDWSWMKQRPQQIMEQFSLHGYTVYYCNMTQSKKELYSAIDSNLILVHNNNYFIRNIVPALKKQGKKIMLWVSWSKLHSFIDAYQPDFVIYDYLDDFSAWKPYLHAMVDRADAVVTTSAVLRAQMAAEYPDKPGIFVPNGCDLAHFRPHGKTPRPHDFAGHKGPVILYSGAWAKWIDHALVEKIAKTFKNALVAIIGVEFGSSVSREIPNLKYLGYKAYNELPGYFHHASVCIIPFLVEEITIATNPIKMYEYLASGTPVVSTDIPEARRVPSVYIGADHAAFLEKIRQILDKELLFSENEVFGWLATQTWEKRFDTIEAALRQFSFLPLPASDSCDTARPDSSPE